MKRLLAIGLAASLLLSIAGCSKFSMQAEPRHWSRGHGPISIVATSNVWADLAYEIGGKEVTSHAIIFNINQDPHSYEATVRDQLLVNKADLVLLNGGGYDDFMTQLSKAKNPATVLNAVKIAGTREDANEHIWLSIERAQKVAGVIAEKLKQLLTPQDASVVDANLAKVNEKFAGLQAHIEKLQSLTAGKKILMAEPVSAYLVDDLLEVNATPMPFSNAVEDGRDIPPKAAAAIKKMLMSRQVSLVVISSSTFDSPAQKLLERNWPNIPTVTVDEVLLQDADTFQWRGGYFDYVDQAISDLAFFNGSDNK